MNYYQVVLNDDDVYREVNWVNKQAKRDRQKKMHLSIKKKKVFAKRDFREECLYYTGNDLAKQKKYTTSSNKQSHTNTYSHLLYAAQLHDRRDKLFLMQKKKLNRKKILCAGEKKEKKKHTNGRQKQIEIHGRKRFWHTKMGKSGFFA